MGRTLGVVPVRMESSRFPGKPLQLIHGIPMLAHCYERALLSDCDAVYISTPNMEIVDWCKQMNISCVLTGSHHERATDRAEETLRILEEQNNIFEHIVLVQGDEPQVSPNEITSIIYTIKNTNSSVVNTVIQVDSTEAESSDVVKAIIGKDNNVLIFSRSKIPFNGEKFYRQMGMIAFSNRALKEYSALKPTYHEELESIDMMRFLDNDISIIAHESFSHVIGVDRPKDLEKVISLFARDKFFSSYSDKYF